MIHVQVSESLLPEGVSLDDETLSLQDLLPFDDQLLVKAAQETLDQQAAPSEAEITLLLSDDPHLQALNRQFLEIDAPTDVLSFPAGEDEIDPDEDVPYLGDIIISVERARLQAEAGGHALESELQLLVVHGVLHLLGHDHAEDEEKAVMWAAQAEVLYRLGITDLRLID